MNNVFSAKSETFAELCATNKTLRSLGRYKLSTSNVIQTPPSTAEGEVSFPPPYGGKYEMMAHTHNSPASSTFSVFSLWDLEGFAELLKLDKIDTNKFVAFLITADGTSYALTIDNPDKYKKFFALEKDPGFDISIAAKRATEYLKYYPDFNSPNPIIKENNIDNIADEKAFLDLLQDNDMGVSLFEVNSTFTGFDKVSHDKTTGIINKQPCN